LLLWNQNNWCTCDSVVRNKGCKTYQTGHVTIKLTSFCLTLHCINCPKPLRLSLVGSQALRFAQRLWMCTVQVLCWVLCSK